MAGRRPFIVIAALLAAGALPQTDAQSWSRAQCAGALPISVDGAVQTWQVVTSAGAKGVAANASALSLVHDQRAYIVGACSEPLAFSAALYATTFKLLGSTLNFTVDLSTAGCACNVAFYLVSMPGYGADNQPDAGEGDGYCDANDVGSQWCPEMDILEANTAAMAVTPHTCSPPTGKHYSKCDKGGCSVNSYKQQATLFGLGSSFMVDSRRPFVVSTSFPADATGQLAAITTIISQGVSSFMLRHTDANCGAGYLEGMTSPLAAGMVPAVSVWGDGGSEMSWLDVPPCSANTACDAASAVGYFSGFSINKL